MCAADVVTGVYVGISVTDEGEGDDDDDGGGDCTDANVPLPPLRNGGEMIAVDDNTSFACLGVMPFP